jgi:putative ABC transport system permease protein
MSLWRQFTRGFRTLTNRDAADRNIGDEAQLFLDQSTADFVARGFSPEEARRAAQVKMGNMTNIKEEVRSYGWENIVATFFSDLRFGIRQLRNNPGFSLVTVLTLALGIGATTAIFSAVNPILFQPLPYPHADRVMTIWELGANGSHGAGTYGMYRSLSAENKSFESMAILRRWQPAISGGERPDQLEGQLVSSGYFHSLGVAPAIGRDFVPADNIYHAPPVTVLSYEFWRRYFNSDPQIVGRQIILDDTKITVIGVMPANFENILAPKAELWGSLQYDIGRPNAWGHHLRTIGRLRPGVSAAQAARELDALGADVFKTFHPETYADEVHFAVNSLQEDTARGVKPALLAVIGAVFLVLLIACVNVTNLLLARGARRRAEFAMRAALGAGRMRLIRQVLTESLLLSGIAGIIGIAIAALGVRALIALSPTDLPRLNAISINGPVLLFALGISALVGLIFGVFPALNASRSDLNVRLQQGSRRSVGGTRQFTRSALVVIEVALALVLLVVSGLLLRSMRQLFSVAPGFNSSQLLTMRVQTTGRHMDDKAALLFFQQTLEAARRVPGVTAAAYTSQLPLSGDSDMYGVQFESDPAPDRGSNSFRYAVSPGYFEAMGIPLLRGRLLNERDTAGAPVAVLINDYFARQRFGDKNPIGQRLHVGPTNIPWFTIVGVVGDVKQVSLATNDENAIYITPSQSWYTDPVMSLVVRARGDVSTFGPAVREAIWSVDKNQPVVRVATMDGLLATLSAERRFALILFEVFAFAALLLAAAGIYGVLSGNVAERTREIGVRAALGASRANILALVLRQGMLLTGIGVAIGLVGATAATQAVAAMLFGISRLDPITYFGVIALLVIVSAIACAVPAWRAARVDPAITLRAE